MTAAPDVTTLGALRESGFAPRTLRAEILANLERRLRAGEPLFPGIRGYDETVIPAVENALLCGHDIIFLGERGQAKTRMIRAFTGLLDEWIPVRIELMGARARIYFNDMERPALVVDRLVRGAVAGGIGLTGQPGGQVHGHRLVQGQPHLGEVVVTIDGQTAIVDLVDVEPV